MTTISRVFPMLALAVALALPSGAQVRPRPRPESRPEGRPGRVADPRNGPEVIDRFSQTVRLPTNGVFDLSNISGNIVITGVGGSDARIDAVKRTRSRDEAAGKARLQEIKIEIRELGSRVEVRTVYPGERRNLGAVDYTVTVPQGASVGVKSVSGDVRVTNVRGTLRAQSVSGDVEVAGARLLEAVRSVSGDIQIADAVADDIVAIRTVSGNQVVRGLKARGVDSSSVSGGLRIENCECERADLKTIAGNIEYGGELGRNGRYEMTSHSGDIRLAVREAGFDLEANTFSGDVRSDFQLKDYSVTEIGRRRGVVRTMRGSFGDGSAILNLRSFSGNITVAKRP